MKNLIKSTSLYPLWFNYQIGKMQKAQLEKWKEEGQPTPPPHEHKQATIIEYCKRFSIKAFVETGTFKGRMIEILQYRFNTIDSIELNLGLYQKAKEKFSKYKHITIHHGDSSDVLPLILEKLNEPAIFWLDGHYSEGITSKGALNTPILSELNHILSHSIKEHVILIDDARCFNGENDYPSLDELRNLVKQRDANLKFSCEDDIIRIHS